MLLSNFIIVLTDILLTPLLKLSFRTIETCSITHSSPDQTTIYITFILVDEFIGSQYWMIDMICNIEMSGNNPVSSFIGLLWY